MSNYELLVITSETAENAASKAVQSKIEEIVKKSKGTVTVEDWGKRMLAYDINDERTGMYTMYKIDGSTDLPAKLEAALRIMEGILRYMTIAVEEPVVLTNLPLRDLEPDAEVTLSYKNPDSLGHFVTDRGKIVPRRISKLNAKNQRILAREIKRARLIAFLPFTTMGQ